MSNFNLEMYAVAKKFKNLKEIVGTKHNPAILDMHKITKAGSTDEIPWCSSFVNFCFVLAGLQRNPLVMANMLRSKGFDDTFVKYLMVTYLGLSSELADTRINMSTGLTIPTPTWSAWARSWHTSKLTGMLPVSRGELKEGDIIVFTRGDGGHVAFFEKSNLLTYTTFGGNQSNMVCSDTYSKFKFLGAKRSIS